MVPSILFPLSSFQSFTWAVVYISKATLCYFSKISQFQFKSHLLALGSWKLSTIPVEGGPSLPFTGIVESFVTNRILQSFVTKDCNQQNYHVLVCLGQSQFISMVSALHLISIPFLSQYSILS